MYEREIDFSTYCSLRVGGRARVLVLERGDEDKFSALEHRCIGHGYNLIVTQDAKNLAILSKEFDYIDEQQEWIEVGANSPSGKIFAFWKHRDLQGLEFLQALPGSMGGLLAMNAGMKIYDMKDSVISACVNGVWIEDLGLSYRKSAIRGIISAVRMKKTSGFRHDVWRACQAMRKTHPALPSCGSCFKNPPNDYAGRLLELAGLRGFMRGSIGFSKEHANFLVHDVRSGKASVADALWMIEHARDRVLAISGIRLEEEVQILR